MSQKLLQRFMHNTINSMKNLFLCLAFMLIGSFTFANTQSFKKQKDVIIENCANNLKISFDLGDLTNLSEKELYNLLDNLPTQVINSERFDTCTITYSLTISVLGQSVEISASGTASTCAEAGKIARSGIKSEAKNAEAMVNDLMN